MSRVEVVERVALRLSMAQSLGLSGTIAFGSRLGIVALGVACRFRSRLGSHSRYLGKVESW
jgi:hypothetical protein